MSKVIVAALGGNALLRGNQIGTSKEQEQNAKVACENLYSLIENGDNLIISHGNGPQVGNILLRNEAGFDEYKIPKMPLDVCVADSQGGIGYMLERQMHNILIEKNVDRNIITFVTQVAVKRDDPAFENPTKPVGKYFLKEEAELLAKSNKWVFKEDPRKRGWRRVVPSPQPYRIFNTDIIHTLTKQGNIIIASGGGGIPVVEESDGKIVGIEAVIDKDLASSLLASTIKADEFYILTDVEKVYINFNKPDEKAIDEMTVEQAEQYMEQGEFAAGSMAPKIKACINFVKNGGGTAVITEAGCLGKEGAGTRIIP